MENAVGTILMGSILCRHCGTLIDTLDTEKVTIYYSDCLGEECVQENSLEEEK